MRSVFGASGGNADHSPSAVRERQAERQAEDRRASVQRANDSTRTNPVTLAQIQARQS